jgi:hypothetical protein
VITEACVGGITACMRERPVDAIQVPLVQQDLIRTNRFVSA